jgi:hypothetical protein
MPPHEPRHLRQESAAESLCIRSGGWHVSGTTAVLARAVQDAQERKVGWDAWVRLGAVPAALMLRSEMWLKKSDQRGILAPS